jgi:spermidine synthase
MSWDCFKLLEMVNSGDDELENYMKPQIKLATTSTPDGGVMELYEHDRDYSIRINGLELMNSRQHESEQELARLGCSHLTDRKAASVLIGGLGMGYTLRQALDILAPDANIVVSELLTAVIDWNREYFGELNTQALDDKRVAIVTGDISELISQSVGKFDAILLDVDNGPTAMTDSGNQRLYSSPGILACRHALRKQGRLAIWSTEPSKAFERLMLNCGFQVRRYKVKAYPGSNAKKLFIWVAAEDATVLPPGGGEPRPSVKKAPAEKRKSKLFRKK